MTEPRRPAWTRRPILGLAAAVLMTGAIAADRLSPAGAAAPALVRPASPGGVLACPFFFAGNGRAWLHLVNAGDALSKITVTTVRQGATPIFRTFTLGPQRSTTMSLDANVKQASSAIVEYAGGSVAASRTALFAQAEDRRGGTAAPCTRAGDRTIVVPGGTTLNADTSVVLLNPASSDALADVTLLADGEEFAPEGLKSVIVPARSRRVIRVGDFAFDRKSVATVVRVRTGVLAADGVISSRNGITLSPGGAPRETLAGIAPGDGGTVLADVVALGEANSLTEASVLTVEGQSAFGALAQDLEPATPVTVSPGPEKVPVLGVRLTLRDGSPLAAGLRWVVRLPTGKSDVAAGMMGDAARRLLAVAGDPATPAQSRLLVANPSEAPAELRFTVFTAEGVADGVVEDGTLEPGVAVTLPIGAVKGSFGILVESSQPVVAAISSTVVGREVSSFSVTALPAPAGAPVGVIVDPRLGVPALLRRRAG